MASSEANTIAARLRAMAPAISGDSTEVDSVARLSGGAVNEIWAFDLLTGNARIPLVLRRSAGGERASRDGMPLTIEAAIIARAAEHGIPVPAPRFVLRPEHGLGQGFISDRIEGETLGGRIARSTHLAFAREGLAWRCGEVLAAIHALDKDGLHLDKRTARSFVDEQTARYRALRKPRPVLAFALKWLEANVPENHPVTLVHGDFRNGNLIVGPSGLRAVLDWEGAHISDPMADLGFICVPSWRFGVNEKPVGGFGSRDELMGGYAAAGGAPDATRAKFWEIFGSFRWALMCALTAESGSLGSSHVESALIARRTSESEIDLLDRITGAAD